MSYKRKAVKPWIVNYYVPQYNIFYLPAPTSIMFLSKIEFLSSSSCVANKTNFILPPWLFLSFRIFAHIFQYIYLNYLFFSFCFKICEWKIISFFFLLTHPFMSWFGGDVWGGFKPFVYKIKDWKIFYDFHEKMNKIQKKFEINGQKIF